MSPLHVVWKYIDFYRHAKKDSGHISEEGRQEARRIVIPRNDSIGSHVTDAFFGPLVRTKETLEEILAANNLRPLVHSRPINEIGSPEVDSQIGTPEFMAAREGRTNLEAMDEAFSPEQVKEWEKFFGSGVQKMFDQMKGRIGLAAGHDPNIALAARHFGLIGVRSLKELEHIRFRLWADDTIDAIWPEDQSF